MVPDRLSEIINKAMDHRLIRPEYDPATPLHRIEMDGLERQEIALGIEDELGLDLGEATHENWLSINDIITTYTSLGGV